MKIQGRTCTLTVAKDNTYIPLPYSEETVRETSKGYVLPAVIEKRNREKYVETKRVLEGCFVRWVTSRMNKRQIAVDSFTVSCQLLLIYPK